MLHLSTSVQCLYILDQITLVNLSTLAIDSSMQQIELAGNSKNMPAIRSEAVALVVIAFYFLALEKQTETSRFQQLLLLQHLKKSRRKWMMLTQMASQIESARRARRAWSWPRNQFWFKNLLQRAFVKHYWKENFRISRRQLGILPRWLVQTW